MIRDRGEVGGDRLMTKSEQVTNNVDFSNPVSIPTICDESTFWEDESSLLIHWHYEDYLCHHLSHETSAHRVAACSGWHTIRLPIQASDVQASPASQSAQQSRVSAGHVYCLYPTLRMC